MRLRRTLAAGLALGMLLLAGCGATPGPAASVDASSRAVAPTGTLNVYAAASLSGVFEKVGDAFEHTHPGVTVTGVYDGSSTLATQIIEGAPADVFASADEANMAKLGDAAVDPRLFATNTLVIAVPAGNPAGIENLADLAGATVVLCAPEVPCGAASQTLLANAGVAVIAASLEQNVSAVLAKITTGEADAGLVYATDVRDAAEVDAIVPEGAADVVNRYPIATIAGSADAAAAEDFVAFVLSDEGRAILAAAGFGAP